MQNESQVRYLGVDVSKHSLDLDLPSPDDHIPNRPEAIVGLLSRLPEGAHLVCESTGGYENALVDAALAAGVPISAVPPQRVRHLALNQGRLAKTDKIDAVLLSDYGRARRPVPLQAPEPERARLRELLRARAQLLELKTIEASWAEHAPTDALLRRQAGARAKLMDKQLEELEHQIRGLAQSASLRSKLERLQQVQGVGEVTAWTVCAEMPELGSLDEGQAAGLAGLAPHPRDSGRQNGKRFIQQGRPQVRRVLYMAAVTAARCNPVLSVFYQRLRARGKPAKVALIAVARRLIELLNLLLKNPNFCLGS
jgi:transposase